MNINAHTDLYCILGNPVHHSLSPVMHNTAFKKLGINAIYCALSPTSIKAGIEAIRTLGIKGASITIPYKTEAIRYIDEIDDMAKIIGAINTISNSEGKIRGYNTDGYGAIQSLRNGGVQVRDRNYLVIGNGGSARAISFSLLEEGASVLIAGRNDRNVAGLADELKSRYDSVSGTLLSKLNAQAMERIDVIINSTPLGMHPDVGTMPIDIDLVRKNHIVFDIVYTPHTTRFLNEAKKRGCRVIYGIDMLVNQGARQFEIWTGASAPIDVITRELRKLTVRLR